MFITEITEQQFDTLTLQAASMAPLYDANDSHTMFTCTANAITLALCIATNTHWMVAYHDHTTTIDTIKSIIEFEQVTQRLILMARENRSPNAVLQ